MQTLVHLTWIEGRIERWIRFGQMAGETILTRTEKRVAFGSRRDLRARPLVVERPRHR